MDWETFRALETFAILFDIAVDQEDYNTWCRISGGEGDDDPATRVVSEINDADNGKPPWARTSYQVGNLWEQFAGSSLHLKVENKIPERLKKSVEEGRLLKSSTGPSGAAYWQHTLNDHGGSDQVAQLWLVLLAGKAARAFLQSKRNSAASAALSELGFELIRSMPRPALMSTDTDGGNQEERAHQARILRWLFLNEAAACFEGSQSAALARECVERIESELKGKRLTPYELLALYNEALGHWHERDYERALHTFGEVIKRWELAKNGENSYRYWSDEGTNHYAWPGGQDLFDVYVVVPACLQSAEIIIKLQRSLDASKQLERTAGKNLTIYQQARKQVLEKRIENDRQDYDRDWQPDGGGKADIEWIEVGLHGQTPPNLASQRLAVEVERYVSLAGKLAQRAASKTGPTWGGMPESASGQPDPAEAWLQKASWYLEKAREAIDLRLTKIGRQKSELDDTILQWVVGVKACADILGACGALRDSNGAQRSVSTDVLLRVCSVVESYWNLALPTDLAWDEVKLVREAAAHLCHDVHERVHQDEVQNQLCSNLEKLLNVLDGSASLPVEHNLREATGTYWSDLIAKLRRHNRIPEFFRHQLSERAALLAGTSLPLSRDGSNPDSSGKRTANAHGVLQRFLHMTFVVPRERDSQSLGQKYWKSVRRKLRKCRRCWKYKEGGRPGRNCVEGPDPCAEPLLRANPDFVLERSSVVSTSEKREKGAQHHYDWVVWRNTRAISEALLGRGSFRKRDLGRRWLLAVLRRWNSYTPALGPSEGGGYFLFHSTEEDKGDAGIVIDPGYRYLWNFFGQGFGVRDITGIAVTHDHPDHLADFEPLVNLFLEIRKQWKREELGSDLPKVELLLSEGAHYRLRSVIESAREIFRDTYVRNPFKGERSSHGDASLSADVILGCENKQHVVVHPKKSLHKDASDTLMRHGWDCMGLLLELKGPASNGSKGTVEARIAIPGDTKWDKDVASHYFVDEFGRTQPLDMLCLHIGSLWSRDSFGLLDFFDLQKTSRSVLHRGWHLYLPGAVWFIDLAITHALCPQGSGKKATDPMLVVLSEFGEELSQGLRVDLAKRLSQYVRMRDDVKRSGRIPLVIVPGDVGLLIDPVNHEIKCSCCQQFHSWAKGFEFEVFGEIEQIFYVCPACQRLSVHERHVMFAKQQEPMGRPVWLR